MLTWLAIPIHIFPGRDEGGHKRETEEHRRHLVPLLADQKIPKPKPKQQQQQPKTKNENKEQRRKKRKEKKRDKEKEENFSFPPRQF